MKKTPLKRKTASQKKKTRRKKTERQKAEEKLWKLCKAIIRKRYQNEDGTWTCFTTGATLTNPRDVQTGHGKPKGALPLLYKYDLRNLRPQSYNANINYGGMTDIFVAKLEQDKFGLSFLQEACVYIDGKWEIKHVEPMGSAEALEFLQDKIEHYQLLLEQS